VGVTNLVGYIHSARKSDGGSEKSPATKQSVRQSSNYNIT